VFPEATTYASGRKVANAVLLVFKSDQTLSERSFLMSCHEISAVNYTTVARVLSEAMWTLTLNGGHFTICCCYLQMQHSQLH
jgi:hypothetical protein